MAKRNKLDKAIDEVLKDFTNNVEKAAKSAAKETTVNIFDYAMTCLEQYYENYDPTSYKRTESLQRAILPYVPEITNNGTEVTSTVGINYDSSKLFATYYGSKKYQPVDDEYVLLNYLYGIHPATNGSSDPLTVQYYEFDDTDIDDNPWNKMEKYLTTKVPNIYRAKLLKHLFK